MFNNTARLPFNCPEDVESHTTYYQSNHIKDNGTGKHAQHTWERGLRTVFWPGNLKETTLKSPQAFKKDDIKIDLV